MTCNEFRDRVEDLLDDLLPPEDAGRFEAHRDGCSTCRTQWEEAGRFRSLLAREGRAALGAWEARRLTLNAAAQLPGEGRAVSGAAPRRRFTFLRLAAAAVLIAAAGVIGSGLLGEPGPVALADGVATRLDPGAEATFGHDCRLVVEDRATTVTLRRARAEGEADVVALERGVALFRVHPEHALAVTTDQGTARAVGATFVVDVRTDGAVALDVVTGRVRLERESQVITARSGERVEVDSGGVAHVVSRARMDELEMLDHNRSDELETVRADLERAERQLEDYAAAAQGAPDPDPAGDELPYDELGRVIHVLTDRSIPWRDARRNEAMAFFLLNAERIRQEFGASDPLRAVAKPPFVAAVAEGYLAAVSPEASPTALATAIEGVRAACARADAANAQDPLPTELAASRQRALIDIIRVVDSELGSAAAATVIGTLGSAWDGPRPTVHWLDDRLESRIVGFWQKTAGLDEDQTNRVAALVRAYIAESVGVQSRVAAALTAEEAERVLYPRSRWNSGRRRNGGSRTASPDQNGSGNVAADSSGGSGAEPAAGAPEERPEPSASEIVAERLRELDARLHLGEPRRRFERGLANLLTTEQREKAFRGSARLFTFRERPTE